MDFKVEITLVGSSFLPFFKTRIYDSEKIFDDSLRRISVLEKESDICFWIMSFGKFSLIPVIELE